MSHFSIPYLRRPIAAFILSMAATAYAAPVTLDIPAQPLADSIKQLVSASGLSIAVDGALVAGKTAPAVKGSLEPAAALQQLLANSGLVVNIEGNTAVITKSAAKTLKEVSVVGQAPKEGSAEAGYKVEKVKNVGPWQERSLQDTPYSMTSQSAELIKNTITQDPYQLFMMNPIAQAGYPDSVLNQNTPTIRGFLASTFVDGNQLYNNSIVSLADKERVEVITGAQSFLNDAVSVGGTVNYVYKRPTEQSQADISVGNYGGSQYFTHLDAGGPIDKNGKFGYRINLLSENGDTSISDQHTKRNLATLALDWHITNNLLLQPIYSYSYNHMDNPSAYWNSGSGTQKIDFTSWVPDASKTYGEHYSYYESTTKTYGTKFSWNANDTISVHADFLHNDLTSIANRVIDYTNNNGTWNQYYYNYQPGFQHENTGKIYFNAKFNTGSVAHNAVLGYSIDHVEVDANQQYAISSLSNLTGYVPQPTTYLINYYATKPNSIYKSSESERYAFKIGDDIQFNDKWSVLVGVSHSNPQTHNYATNGSISVSTSNGINTPSEYNKSAWTPTLSLLYKPETWLTTYATYIEAMQNGSIVTGNYTNNGQILDPTLSTQYEIGAKANVQNMLLTAALFRLNEVNQYSNNATPIPTLVQDGRQISQGVELTATGKATQYLTIIGGVTLAHDYVANSNNPAYDGKIPTLAVTSGSQPAERMYKMYAEYAIPRLSKLVLTGGAYHVGDSYFDNLNTQKIPGYTIGDIGARYATQFGGYKTTFRINVLNVTDKSYWSSGCTVGTPRTVAASANIAL